MYSEELFRNFGNVSAFHRECNWIIWAIQLFGFRISNELFCFAPQNYNYFWTYANKYQKKCNFLWKLHFFDD